MEREYTASKSRSQGREGWCAIFYHPLRVDERGKPMRVRRGLSTRDEGEADKLIEQLNEVLSDESYWTALARDRASRDFDSRVVSIFYEGIEGKALDAWKLREQVIPLPQPGDGFARILFVGPTGAGKTTLLRQFMGTDPRKERFPSTSTAKTTTFDTEIIARKGDFQTVISLLPRDFVRLNIEECLIAATTAAAEGKPEGEVLRKFFEHTEQRFRLNYILGDLSISTQETEEEDGEEETDEDEMEDASAAANDEKEKKEQSQRIRNYLDRILEFAYSCKTSALEQLKELGETEGDDGRYLELLEDTIVESEPVQSLIDEIAEHIESKFEVTEAGEYERDKSGWPFRWIFRTNKREDFIRELNRYTSNHADKFGRLLTPLVSGIRVAGPFRPAWLKGRAIPKLVFIDGEGLGHTPESATALPTSVTKRYETVEVILVVDNAQQPMPAASQAALRSVAASGNIAKLALAFTHFDQVVGDNLLSRTAKKNHILASVDGVIAAIEKDLGASIARQLSEKIGERTLFVSRIQKSLSDKAQLTRKEFLRLIEVLEAAAVVTGPVDAVPTYDLSRLLIFIRGATEPFHSNWSARLGLDYKLNVSSEHWTRIKALSRRFALQWADQYDNLRPAADLIKALSEGLSVFIEMPRSWRPNNPSQELREAAVARVAQEVFSRLHDLISVRLSAGRLNEWIVAFERRGTGSTRIRARDIQGIYDVAAPMPSENSALSFADFLDAIRDLFEEAVQAAGARII